MREVHIPALKTRSLCSIAALCLGLGKIISASTFAQLNPPESVYASSLSEEGELAIRKFRAVSGMKVELFASEPLLANPVSFTFDETGRVYLVETHRRRSSVYDIRRHPDWLDSDFSFRTVEDRENFLKKVLVPENKSLPGHILHDRNGDGQFDWQDLEVESERVRLIWDRNGDGRADSATTFADGFNSIVSGVAAGVLARGKNVFFACIPDLWLLRDENGDGRADFRKSLLHGFGVHISFGGHDLHGLKMGPDGKLYFSIADRGLHVKTARGPVSYPDSGAVMRCNPDGSDFEIFAFGLRNPQELAFDQFGNLWTGDNNGDAGDKARWVYVLEGGDAGWHLGWQHLPNLGPWNTEKLWELSPINTAAYILPPVAHIGHGPAGLAFYPGTGLPSRYLNHFFMCDFPGGVRSFAVEPRGAGFEMVNLHDFLWELYPVDVEFGVEGGVYVADWIQGWEKTDKGRIYRVYEPESLRDPAIRETKRLLGEGFAKRSTRDLTRLLEHADMRVRMEAQFALAERGAAVTNALVRLSAGKREPLLARLHAIWALGQIGRNQPTATAHLLPLLADADAEVRAQAAKVIGDNRLKEAFEPMAALLQDAHPRVQMFAAFGLGKLGFEEATEPIFQMLRQNADRDLYLRHGAVMALTWLNDVNALISAAKEPSDSIRMAALLALRRLHRPEVAMFLYDSNPALVLEAARAIYDLPIESGLSQVAGLSSKIDLPLPILRRALNAHFRLGKLENALALAEFAGRTDASSALRVEALDLLRLWPHPPGRDLMVGLWRPLPPREGRGAGLALRSELPRILEQAPDPVRIAAIRAAGRLDLAQIGPVLFQLFANQEEHPELRREALRGLAHFKNIRLTEALNLGMRDSSELVRKEAALLESQLSPEDAVRRLAQGLESGSLGEKQAILAALSSIPGERVNEILAGWLDQLLAGSVPRELHLDLMEAAGKRNSDLLTSKLEQFRAQRPRSDSLRAFRETLHGGDAQAGSKIFYEHAEAACLRCHKINGEGGEVGPELIGIGAKQSRESLLESILFPNKSLSPGYETVVVTLKDGAVYSGQVRKETEEDLLLVSPEDGEVLIKKSSIQSRDKGLSAMPEELATVLNKRDLRDLVEFLSTLK